MAGIYNVSTMPEVRRRGIGTAMTMAPLLEAAGVVILAMLHASAMAVPMYQRLGLKATATSTNTSGRPVRMRPVI